MKNIKSNKPELLAPAGSFEAGYAAIEAGADALYFGFRDFSARKGAANFTLSEYLQLKHYASQKKCKLYCTLNTLLFDQDFEKLHRILEILQQTDIDGVIIQDWGVFAFIRKYYPELPLHASTQMNIGTTYSLDFLIQKGFQRAVLPRECNLKQIKELETHAEDRIDLEAFIHGSMCYSISGLCLASGYLCQRSGNQGLCAQICRNYFKQDSQNAYYFSMKDQQQPVENIQKLINAGIRSLKIEGRMKAPEYTASTVRLYRYILDHLDEIDPDQLEDLQIQSQLAFSRSSSEGYLSNKEFRINPNQPESMGILLKDKLSAKKTQTITVRHPLSIHDGLLLEEPSGRTTRFGLKKINIGQKPIGCARKGEIVQIELPHTPEKGSDLFHVQSQNIEWTKPPVKRESATLPLTIGITYENQNLMIATNCGKFQSQMEFPQPFEKAEKPGNPEKSCKKAFYKTGGTLFHIEKIECTLPTGLFVPTSRWNQIRREIIGQMTELCETADLPRKKVPAQTSTINTKRIECKGIPETLDSNSHYLVPMTDKNIQILPKETQQIWFIIPAEYSNKDLRNAENQIKAAVKKKVAGFYINNPGHLSFIKQIAPKAKLRGDAFLYTANSYALDFWLKQGLKSVTAAPELPQCAELSGAENVSDKYAYPIFTSRVCYARENGQPCENCPKYYSFSVTNQEKTFRIEVRNCVTKVYLEK